MITIFITIPWFHPAYKAGGPVQSVANLVNEYAAPGIKFYIYCGNTDLDGNVLNGVAFDEWVSYNQHTQVWYTSSKKREIIQLLVDQVKPDMLFINGIYGVHFTMVPLLFCKAPRKIISVRGMLHSGALNQKALKKKAWLLGWKLLGIHRRYQFHATNEEEKGFIQKQFGNKTKIFIAENFPRSFNLKTPAKKEVGHLTLVSVGIVSAMKNYLLVLQAMAACKVAIEYHIYGSVKDELYWQSCLNVINRLPANIKVLHKGDIQPSKVEAMLSAYQVFILPSKSENFGHAIYEALSSGTPVITSHNTPWNGLEAAMAGKNVSLEIEPITNAINFFAALNNKEYQQWSTGSAVYAAKAIDLDKIQEAYSIMFQQGTDV
ncbi:MAG: glycosyltransferase family 4 protein [Ferruginibacter sp.]|uniref:glycosyltransferase n=1 Tax=Ferruginibacter sp. TaxID=1940288 RepID=UPI00265B4801|nr:glycosyltransferase [Ferruginibacter sp.]MDB5280373.1 glycosyltransferase family 4 protein [Ferruginibacter sp.]